LSLWDKLIFEGNPKNLMLHKLDRYPVRDNRFVAKILERNILPQRGYPNGFNKAFVPLGQANI